MLIHQLTSNRYRGVVICVYSATVDNGIDISTILIHELGVMPSTWLVVDIALGSFSLMTLVWCACALLLAFIACLHTAGYWACAHWAVQSEKCVGPWYCDDGAVINDWHYSQFYSATVGIKHMDDAINPKQTGVVISIGGT